MAPLKSCLCSISHQGLPGKLIAEIGQKSETVSKPGHVDQTCRPQADMFLCVTSCNHSRTNTKISAFRDSSSQIWDLLFIQPWRPPGACTEWLDHHGWWPCTAKLFWEMAVMDFSWRQIVLQWTTVYGWWMFQSPKFCSVKWRHCVPTYPCSPLCRYWLLNSSS